MERNAACPFTFCLEGIKYWNVRRPIRYVLVLNGSDMERNMARPFTFCLEGIKYWNVRRPIHYVLVLRG